MISSEDQDNFPGFPSKQSGGFQTGANFKDGPDATYEC